MQSRRRERSRRPFRAAAVALPASLIVLAIPFVATAAPPAGEPAAGASAHGTRSAPQVDAAQQRRCNRSQRRAGRCADLRTSVVASASEVGRGQGVVYDVLVSNRARRDARRVTLEVTLPGAYNLVGAPQSPCEEGPLPEDQPVPVPGAAPTVVRCELGTIGRARRAQIRFIGVFGPRAAFGALELTARADSPTPDRRVANNTVSETTSLVAAPSAPPAGAQPPAGPQPPSPPVGTP